MTELSTKPYLIRAIYEWCADSGFTPYIGVHVDQNTRVPMEYVKNGEIVLSISMQATRDLTIGNDLVQFSARFGGVSREIAVPIYAVASIFARENGKGMFFERELAPLSIASSADNAPTPVVPPQLQSVPNIASVSDTEIMPEKTAEHAQTEGRNNTKKSASDKPEINKHDNNKPKGPPRGKLRVIK